MTLRLLRSSAGLDPGTLRPGMDLVLDVEPQHALALPDGVAVDDHLGQPERIAIDHAARENLASWRRTRGADILVDGADLGHIAEVELIAQCFLPAERLRRALAATGAAGHIEAHGFDAAALSGLVELAPPSCIVSGAPGAPPPPAVRAGRRTVAVKLIERTPIRPWVRGEILCVPYWNLTGVYSRLAKRHPGPRPVPVGLRLAGLSAPTLAAVVARGGWGGSAGAGSRARSRARVGSQLGGLAEASGLDRWARDVLLRVAGGAPAELAHARRLLRGRARLVVTPFDSPEYQRSLLVAAREHGVPSLVVQHGYDADLGDPDRTVADHVAVWSQRDLGAIGGLANGTITVTGNPGADLLATTHSPDFRGRGRTVVLVEYPGRLSSRVDQRIGLRHLAAALDGVARSRPGTLAVIRPHPADGNHASYPDALTGLRGRLRMVIDSTTPIELLLRTADLCVGAVSTATLQSATLGLATVFLDVSNTRRPWPFDGSPGALPVAHSGPELADVIRDVLGATPPLGAGAAREALGATGAGVDAVLALVDSLLDA
jgi:hypothetical protein